MYYLRLTPSDQIDNFDKNDNLYRYYQYGDYESASARSFCRRG